MRRRAEPRIVDPHNHPKRYVSVAVAADYLEVDRKTLAKLLDAGQLVYQQLSARRRIAVSDLLTFEASRFRRSTFNGNQGNSAETGQRPLDR